MLCVLEVCYLVIPLKKVKKNGTNGELLSLKHKQIVFTIIYYKVQNIIQTTHSITP